MQELIKKIEQLRKTLAAMKPKSVGQSSLVPALKMPSVKPLSMPSASAGGAKTPQLPGISPATGKDPKKVAEQLKDPKPKKPKIEVLKVEGNGQWSLTKADEPGTMKVSAAPVTPSTVDASAHGFGFGHHSPEQDNLIHGLDFSSAKRVGKGINDSMWMGSKNHPHTMIVKNASQHPDRELRGHADENNFDSAKREVMFHNMAKDFFGMGHHVPLTAGFTKDGHNFSAQKKVENASHPHLVDKPNDKYQFENPNHQKVISDLYNSGELHKLALMDNVMGHHDRHGQNYMIDDNGPGLHLIDNGTSFDYGNVDPRSVSSFHEIAKNPGVKGMGRKDDRLHPEAEKWLMGLDPKKAAEIFAGHSYPQDSAQVKGFMNRLKGLQDKVKKGGYGNVERLLASNRGAMHPHHSKKEAA